MAMCAAIEPATLRIPSKNPGFDFVRSVSFPILFRLRSPRFLVQFVHLRVILFLFFVHTLTLTSRKNSN